MKKIGVVSYNIHCNFTNYGSALQSYALCKVIKKLGYQPFLINYLPDCLKDANPLNPYKKLWDKDKRTKNLIKKSLPYIKTNYDKFLRFYKTKFNLTKKFTPKNFYLTKELVDSYVCGSDTIFNIKQFGFEDGYYANYDCMRHNSISYAPSFGDCSFNSNEEKQLRSLLLNFNAISLRETKHVKRVERLTKKKCYKVFDPTLLLRKRDYDELISNEKKFEFNYLLIYSRRFNKTMNDFAEKVAKEKKLKIIEISLNIENLKKGHILKYDAGIEEFLNLIKNAKYVVTNSYHCMIFSILYKKQFNIFLREQCNSKITDLLRLFKLNKIINKTSINHINYNGFQKIINEQRKYSLAYLKRALITIDG